MIQQWNARFVAMSAREKYLIAGATVVCVLLLGLTFLVEPVTKQKNQLEVALASQQIRVTNLQQQVALFTDALKDDPDTPLKAQIARLEQRQHELGIRFADELSELVDPGADACGDEASVQSCRAVVITGNALVTSGQFI